MTSIGAQRIAAERTRQQDAEGYTDEHDDQHVDGELRDAAIALLIVCDDRAGDNAVDVWPWNNGWNPDEDPVRNLERAGALIAAEIDRLERRRRREALAEVTDRAFAAVAANPEIHVRLGCGCEASVKSIDPDWAPAVGDPADCVDHGVTTFAAVVVAPEGHTRA